MATYSTNLQNALASRAVQNLDVLEIFDADGVTVLATFTNLAWGAPSNGQVSVTGLPVEVTASATGTATTAKLRTSGASGESIDSMSVGTTSGNHVVVSNTSINSGQPVRLQSVTFTMPATVNAG